MNIEKFAAIKTISSDIINCFKRIEKLKKVERDFENCSKKRRDNARNDINYIFIDVEMKKHELHCLAVECGLASRDDDRYGDKMFNPDGWHELKKNMREPN